MQLLHNKITDIIVVLGSFITKLDDAVQGHLLN